MHFPPEHPTPQSAPRTPALLSIHTPAALHLQNGSLPAFGANQAWYHSWIRRWSGCGPSAASNLLWYLARTRPQACGPLYPAARPTRDEMLRLMNRVWQYVTPGLHGVDRPSIFVEGMHRYGADHGVPLAARSLEIPAQPNLRPTPETLFSFLANAFRDDLPVAFLNLSNGDLRNLENWHWVTLVSVTPALQAEMYDQGHRQTIDLSRWLSTTTGGGCFLAFAPA